MHVLQHRSNALKPHAGINRWRGQRMELPLRIAVELHKHQIPDLDVAIQIIIFTARRATRYIRSMVIKDLRAGSTGACVAHLPEIVLIESRESGGIDTDFVHPNRGGLIITDVHRDP